MQKTVQYFSDEYLAWCETLSKKEILEFLENFRELQSQAEEARSRSKLISLKVPEVLLETFKLKAQSQGIPYQTQIKNLMREWIF